MGNSIIRMSEQISQLTEFKRKVSHDQMNQSVNEITSRADQKLQSLRRQVEGLCNQGYYEKYKESFVPNAGANDLVMDQATMEDYKSKFTISSFKEELAEYFPLIHSIMQEASEVDLEEYVEEGKTEVDDSASDDTKHEAFDQFIEWANRVEEGRLEPDTIMDLKDLLDGGLTLGVDGVSAIEALQNIGVHSEELEAELKRLGDRDNGGDPESDPKDAILSWLATDDPEAAKELGYQGGGQESPDEDSEQPQMNAQPAGSPREIAELVYSMYNKNHKEEGLGPFPKGAAGVVTAVKKQLGDEAGVLAEKLVDYLSGNHKEQEGLAGAALGGVAGAVATKTPAGAMTGADIGSQIQDKLSDEGSEEDKIPAYIRKQQQQTNQTGQAATDKRNQQAGAKVWSNPRVKEEFDVILKLAGLAK
jgi:outer membrane lipoprotein SlyB